MSIKKSLRVSLLLLSSIPLIFMAVVLYIWSYSKYLEVATYQADEIADTYAQGFLAELDIQLAELNGLANNNDIQNFLLESYNGINLGKDSAFEPKVVELLSSNASFTKNDVNYYLYDVNGYLISSSDKNSNEDWEEYMQTPVEDITKTTVMNVSNINKDAQSIEVITPVKVKNTIVGLIRANIPSVYFGEFIPEDGSAFILTSTGSYLFSNDGLSNYPDIEEIAKEKFDTEENAGHISTNANSVKNLYGYSKLMNGDWLYIIKQDTSKYQAVLSLLPIVFIFTLVIILVVAVQVSKILTMKYTGPIYVLKDKMKLAADGDLDVTCNITNANVEFKELSDSFNSMMSIISKNYNELDESKQILEENEIKLKESYNEIEKLAYHDGLTGLYNRVAFMKYVYEIFQREKAMYSNHAVYFIDLDNFKNVNDTLGHDYGDELLIQVSNKLTSLIDQENDILARTGGDEFLIFRSNYDSNADLEDLATKLINIVRQPFDLMGETASVSMSVGIAKFPENGLSLNELIKNADIAMYSAKTNGKNDYRFFDALMEDEINRKLDLTDILSTVIDNNEVYLVYQPQVNISTGEVTGYEALMRIESEIAGFIPPTEFIPIAEANGIINDLGEWALYEACTFNQSLINKGHKPLQVSVNVSTAQLKGGNLLDIIKSIPATTGMDLKYLEIEITESVLMESFSHNLKLINEIKKLGAKIALDDFGTGYSSFNYLTQIPIDTLKMDKSFIDDITSNQKDQYIADSIITLAHKMNISVVAEGVENSEQLDILRNQFCDTLQGYLFSRPIKDVDFVSLLENTTHAKL